MSKQAASSLRKGIANAQAREGGRSTSGSTGSRGAFILQFLKVQPEELGRATLYLLYLLFAVGVFVLGRNVAAALFLSTYGASSLPWMYVASAITVSLSAWSYARVTGRVRLDKLIKVTLIGLIVVLGSLRAAMWLDAPFVYPLLYVNVEVMGALLVIQFWSLATTTHHTREAKRLFGFIGAGGVLASIVVGFGGAALVMLIGTENLVFVMIACLVVCLVLVGLIGSAGRQQLLQALDSGDRRARKRGAPLSKQTLRVFASGHLRLVAFIVGLTFVVITLVDFQFKTLANQAFEKEALTAFFSLLYGVTGVLALLTQLLVTGRVLERFGVLVALSILPASLLLGSAAVFFVPLALVAAFAKGADSVFRYSVNDVTLQLLYLPVPPQHRLKAKAFIDGILKPLFYGLTGLGLVAATHLLPGLEERIHWLGLLSAGAAAFWIFLVARLRGAYLGSLIDTLHKRRLDLDDPQLRLDDDSAVTVLETALNSTEEAEILRALELLHQIDGRALEQRVLSLLGHRAAGVRRAALSHLGRWGSLQWSETVESLFEDADGEVRAAAIDAYCAIVKEKAIRSVSRFLEDPAPSVRAACVSGMIKWGGLDGLLVSAGPLEGMLSSPDPDLRRHGAEVLGTTGLKSFYHPIIALLGDEDLSVQRAAIASAGDMRSPELVPPLICKLGHPRVGGDAADALVEFGPGIEGALEKVLDNETERPLVRLGVPRVLGRLGTQRAASILMSHLESNDEALKTRCFRWLNRLHVRFPALRVNQRRIQQVMDDEIQEGYRTLQYLDALGLDEAPLAKGGILAFALKERLSRNIDRIFLLLALRFHPRTMEAARAGLESQTRRVRGNALEVLENSLDREVRARLLPLLDERPRKRKLVAGSGFYRLHDTMERGAALMSLLEHASAWIRACALHHLSSSSRPPDAEVGDLASGMVHTDEPVVREVALTACLTHLPHTQASSILERASKDEDPAVKALAEALVMRQIGEPLSSIETGGPIAAGDQPRGPVSC